MANLLPALGTLSYNGFTFSQAVRTESFSAKPVYDSARRTVIYTQFSITVRDYISGSINDTTVQTARRLLTKPGGALIISGRGVGTFNVNVGTQRDVAWGPQPQVVDMRHAGAKQTIEITWRVDFALPDCNQAVFSFAFMEVNYSASYNIDRNGLTTRTLSGYIRIPMTRRTVSSRDLPDSVDNYRAAIDPPRLPGFRRVPGTFTVNADKTRLDFSITDEQLPRYLAPPAGCMDWRASHTLQTQSAVLMNYEGTIEASYEVALGLNTLLAIRHFLQFALFRLQPSFDLARRNAGNKSSPMAVIPRGLTISEPEIAGRQTARFTLNYSLVGFRLTDLVEGSGLWTGGYQQDWQTWDASIGDDFLGPRGVAGLILRNSDDLIVDLCRDDAPRLPPTPPTGRITRTLTGRQIFDLFPDPGPTAAWIGYYCSIQIEHDSGTAELRALPEQRLPFTLATPGTGVQQGLPTTPAAQGKLINDWVPRSAQPETTIQRRAGPGIVFYIIGQALRYGHPIPVPVLSKVDGHEPRSANRRDRGEGFATGVVGNYGLPVYAATWRLRYLLDRVPDVGIDKFLPKNPLYEPDARF